MQGLQLYLPSKVNTGDVKWDDCEQVHQRIERQHEACPGDAGVAVAGVFLGRVERAEEERIRPS